MKKILVLGAGGFIGAHLVNRLKEEGHWVRGVDLKYPPYAETQADDFLIGDLRDPAICSLAIDMQFDEVYQLAADMGGAGFIFVGTNDYDIMHNSAQINLNVIEGCRRRNIKRIFYSSSAEQYSITSKTVEGFSSSEAPLLLPNVSTSIFTKLFSLSKKGPK